MRIIQAPETKETPDRLIDNMSGLNTNNRISLRGLISIITESLLAGLALFLAFQFQKSYFDLRNQQFLIGRQELIHMSMAITFCYAFISVLRRNYSNMSFGQIGNSIKQTSKTLIETYTFYLALLFLVKDINFASVKLALGMALLLGAVVLFPYHYFMARFFGPVRITPVPRKITLKKRPSSIIPERHRQYSAKDSENAPSARSERQLSKSTAITVDNHKMPRKHNQSVYSDFADE